MPSVVCCNQDRSLHPSRGALGRTPGAQGPFPAAGPEREQGAAWAQRLACSARGGCYQRAGSSLSPVPPSPPCGRSRLLLGATPTRSSPFEGIWVSRSLVGVQLPLGELCSASCPSAFAGPGGASILPCSTGPLPHPPPVPALHARGRHFPATQPACFGARMRVTQVQLASYCPFGQHRDSEPP